MYLIDTNILSEACRGPGPAARWPAQADAEACFLSVITIGEIVKGIALKQRRDPRTAQNLQRWLDQLCTAYADHVLPVTWAVAAE